jgi:short-subunit dehydrogenase
LQDHLLISGGNRGLGKKLCIYFVEKNYNLIIIARDLKELKKTSNELKSLNSKSKISFFKCDISKKKNIDRLISDIVKKDLRVRFIINNASIFGPIEKFSLVDFYSWKNTFDVNLFGTANLIHSFLPLLKKNKKRSKIINIVGGGASKPYPFLSSYATSKAALIRLTEELSEEFKQHKIDINSIAPGPLKTRFIDIVLREGKKKLGNDFYNQILNIEKSGGTPFSLTCYLCDFLISTKGDSISGKYLSARYDNITTLFKLKKSYKFKGDYLTMRRIDK